MIETLKNFGAKKLGGLILIIIIIIAFGFGGFGGGFSTNNQNNIAKINNTNVTTQNFMDYLSASRISQQAIRENLNNNIIEELLSGLVSTTLIDLEIKDFNLSITDLTVLKKIKENKIFQDENKAFKRTKYEKFLLSNNMSATMFEQELKIRELQKHLFDFIGAGTITPNFLIQKKYEEENKTLNIKYFEMESFYKKKDDLSDTDLESFIEENKEQLKREYINFRYVELNPKNLIGLDEFNQEFFDNIDNIENKISQGETFQSIIENLNVDIVEIKEFSPSNTKKNNEDKIYSNRATELDIIENGDSFILYLIEDKFNRSPDISDITTKNEIADLLYQKNMFDFNRGVLEEIQNKTFNDIKFNEMGGDKINDLSLTSINDVEKFEKNSINLLYTLPTNSFTFVNDKDNKIYLVKIINSKNNSFNENDESYIKFVKDQNTNNRKNILQSYDQLLNNKYQVELNQKTIDRVKNYFK